MSGGTAVLIKPRSYCMMQKSANVLRPLLACALEDALRNNTKHVSLILEEFFAACDRSRLMHEHALHPSVHEVNRVRHFRQLGVSFGSETLYPMIRDKIQVELIRTVPKDLQELLRSVHQPQS